MQVHRAQLARNLDSGKLKFLRDMRFIQITVDLKALYILLKNKERWLLCAGYSFKMKFPRYLRVRVRISRVRHTCKAADNYPKTQLNFAVSVCLLHIVVNTQ